MPLKRIIPIISLFLLMLYPEFVCADASPPLIIQSSITSSSLSGYLDLLEDKTGKLTISEVSSADMTGRFETDNRPVPYFGSTSSIFWVRFAIGSESNSDMQLLLELAAPRMDYVDFYIPIPGGGFRVMQAGEMRPISQRTFRHVNPIFPLIINSQIKTYYLRIDARGWASVPLTILSPNTFVTNENRRSMIDGGYFGAMLVMVIYNLFVFISLRDKTYLYYFLDIFGFALYIFSIKGLLIGFVSEKMLWLNNYDAVIVVLPIMTGLLFCRSFLNTAIHTPFIDSFLKLLIGVAGGTLPAIFLLPLDVIRHALTVISFLASITALVAGVACLIRGYHPARYFIVARIFRITGVLSFSLSLLFPLYLPTLLGLQIGSTIEVAILAFALADRIKVIRHEKQELQAEAIRAGHLSALGELAAGVAHEINTPVNTIINSADLILDNKEKSDTVHDIEIIKTQGRRIATIARSLLFFSRQPEQDKVSFSVADMLQGTLDMIGTSLRKDCIHLFEKIPDDLMPVLVHPQQIEQVFLNIITNAMHALAEKHVEKPNGKTLTIEAFEFVQNDQPFVRISFLDNGIGIPAGLLDRVTQSFVTTKKSGAGLGLSISRKIIESHGGTIRLESRVGEYTRVSIDLPAVKPVESNEIK